MVLPGPGLLTEQIQRVARSPSSTKQARHAVVTFAVSQSAMAPPRALPFIVPLKPINRDQTIEQSASEALRLAGSDDRLRKLVHQSIGRLSCAYRGCGLATLGALAAEQLWFDRVNSHPADESALSIAAAVYALLEKATRGHVQSMHDQMGAGPLPTLSQVRALDRAGLDVVLVERCDVVLEWLREQWPPPPKPRAAVTQRLASASDEGEEDKDEEDVGEGGESGVLGLAKARATPEARAERAAAHSVRGNVRSAEYECAPGQRGALAAQGHFESFLERGSLG